MLVSWDCAVSRVLQEGQQKVMKSGALKPGRALKNSEGASIVQIS